MPNEPTLTPNSGGWNCTSADKKICVYGRTQEEAIMRMKLAHDWSKLSRAQKIREMERAAMGGKEQSNG